LRASAIGQDSLKAGDAFFAGSMLTRSFWRIVNFRKPFGGTGIEGRRTLVKNPAGKGLFP